MDSTVVFTFDCFRDNPSTCNYPALPFPAFDQLKGKSFPVFELTQAIVIDQDMLDIRMDPIFWNHH